MNKSTLASAVLASISCSGCAALFGDLSRYDQNSQAFRQCAYEAKANTPGTMGAIEAVARERELTDLCMKAKGH